MTCSLNLVRFAHSPKPHVDAMHLDPARFMHEAIKIEKALILSFNVGNRDAATLVQKIRAQRLHPGGSGRCGL